MEHCHKQTEERKEVKEKWQQHIFISNFSALILSPPSLPRAGQTAGNFTRIAREHCMISYMPSAFSDIQRMLRHQLRSRCSRTNLSRWMGDSEESRHELGGIGDKILEFAVDRVQGKDRIFAHIWMSVFEARAAGGYQRFQQFLILCNLLQKAEASTANIFVGVLLESSQHMPLSIFWKTHTRSFRIALLYSCFSSGISQVQTLLTQQESSLASACHFRRTLGKPPNRNVAVSLVAYSVKASRIGL